MGMAASQARFLGLTARKTNTEYEGQQVNQERTALANQSAGLFNRMLALSVPIPPDSTGFYSTQYTYSDNEGACKILNYSPTGETDTYNLVVEKTLSQNSFVNNGIETAQVTTHANDDGTTSYYFGDSLLSGPTSINGYIDGSTNLTTANYFSYTTAGSTSSKYLKSADVTTNADSGEAAALKNYTIQTVSKTQQSSVSNAVLKTDSNGRFCLVSTGGSSYAVSYAKVEDEEGYTRAMNEYTVAKENYDKEVSDINAQTEIIQQQDRTLELRLKQLDTEQSALQTELEAVSKVIDKNVESTFKTFA